MAAMMDGVNQPWRGRTGLSDTVDGAESRSGQPGTQAHGIYSKFRYGRFAAGDLVLSKRKYDLTYHPENETLVTVGGSEAIDLAIRAIVNPGDEVLIVEPSFVCYKPIVELMHGMAIPISTQLKNKFKLTAEELRSHITERTKLLILPYPNNPTGGIMTREDLEAIAEVLRDTNVLVLSDEIYSELTYGRKHVSIASIDGMWERTIYVSGFSKAFAMTGWRLAMSVRRNRLQSRC